MNPYEYISTEHSVMQNKRIASAENEAQCFFLLRLANANLSTVD